MMEFKWERQWLKYRTPWKKGSRFRWRVAGRVQSWSEPTPHFVGYTYAVRDLRPAHKKKFTTKREAQKWVREMVRLALMEQALASSDR